MAPEVDRPVLVPLAEDYALPGGHVHARHPQLAQLGGPHSCVEKEADKGVVPLRMQGLVCGGDQGGHLPFVEGLDLVSAGDGGGYGLRRRRLHDAFLDDPAEQGPQVAVVGVDGAGTDGLCHEGVAFMAYTVQSAVLTFQIVELYSKNR